MERATLMAASVSDLVAFATAAPKIIPLGNAEGGKL